MINKFVIHDQQLLDTIAKIIVDGGKVYAVGGAVRDAILGKSPKDMDFCVTGLSWDEFQSLFPESRVQGKDFPVFNLSGCEFALARTERKVGVGYKAFETYTDKNLTIYDDLKRRDFTMNAIAVDMETNQIIDPFYGEVDIENKLLKAVSSAFAEDPLRVYRGARFAAQLGFDIEYGTTMMMKSLKEEMRHLTIDRVTAELMKVMVSNDPYKFFYELAVAEVLDVHFPDINVLRGVQQPEKFHKHDAFMHSMEALMKASELTKDAAVRWAALTHDLGKGLTPKELWPKHNGHEEAGVPVIEAMGEHLQGMPKEWTKAAMVGAAQHMRAWKWKEMRPSTFVDLVESINRSTLGFDGLAVVVKADHLSRGFDVDVSSIDEMVKIGKSMLKEVNGKTITFKEGISGPAFGKAIRDARINWYKQHKLQRV